jgi:2-dehydropantoate 2-reductase
MNKKYLIIGSGAIGTFYSSRLSMAGQHIISWSRNDRDFIANNGYKVKSFLGDYDFFPNQLIANPEDLTDEVDYVIVSTKALPSINIVSILKKVVSKNTAIIIIQNGIHIENEIAKHFPDNQIISAIAFIGVSRDQINVIRHQEYGKLIVGNYNNIDLNSINYFVESIKKTEIEVVKTENILMERWKKLVWNGAFNPLSVVLGKKTTRQILDNKLARKLAENIMQEIVMLAKNDNCELPENIIDVNITATEQMSPYKTSMLLDYEANRPMEIDAIIGNAIKFGQSKSISTPYLSTIYAILSNY